MATRGGSATRVATAATRPAPPAAPPRPAPVRLAADFVSGVPDLASAPREDWAWGPRSLPGRLKQRTRLPRPRREPAAARSSRRLPAARSRRRHHRRPGHHLLRDCPGPRAGPACPRRPRAGPGRLRRPRVRGQHHRHRGLGRAGGRPGTRRRPRRGRGRAGGVRRGRGRAHPGTPVADRWGPRPRAAARADRLGRPRAGGHHRGRLRRRFRYDRDPVGAPQGLAPDRVVAWVPSANPWPPSCGWAGSPVRPDPTSSSMSPSWFWEPIAD